MKSIRNLLGATLLTAGAVLAAGVSLASGADEATTAQPPLGPQGWHHRGGPWQLLNKLDLTAAQKQQVKDIMTAARPQMQSGVVTRYAANPASPGRIHFPMAGEYRRRETGWLS